MIKGNLIRVTVGKSNVVIASRFGSLSVPTGKIKKANQERKAKQLVSQIIPKSDFIGSIERSRGLCSVLFFSAPKGWNGGVNA